MEEDDSNEMSWLKSGVKSTVDKQSRAVSPRAADNKDAPSWLFEENDAKSASAKDTPTEHTPPKSTLSKLAGGIKWKQPINRTGPAEEEDDGDSCCCCCPSDPMLFAFTCFHCAAGLVGITALVANVYVFTRRDLAPKDAIMRSYALLFCALVVIIELDWRFVVNKIRFVDWWVLRGLFYTFVGFVTCKRLNSSCVIVVYPDS
jgi:hypothetical protein